MTVPRPLVVLRYPRGSAPPSAAALEDAIQADRRRLRLPPAERPTVGLAGPYAIEVDGQALDEWVAWET